MGHFFSIFAEFIEDLKNQKLRTFLTLFGIVWGTVAIVMLLALGFGFKRQLTKTMHGIGQGIAIMFSGQTTKSYHGFNKGRAVDMHESDVALLTREVPKITAISPEYSQRNVQVRRGEKKLNPNITGCYPVFHDMRNVIPQFGGRFINDMDMQQRRRVVFLGDEVKKFLFGEDDAVGQTVYLGETPLTVIGILAHKQQNSSYNSRDQDRVFIPSTTFTAIYGVTVLRNLIYQVTDLTASDAVEEEVRQVLARRYKFDPTDKDAIGIWNTAELDKFLFYFFLAFNVFMGMIGSFTLAVGGLGVANIMFIVVQERTREIGIKRSLGARRTTILWQFFVETLFIVGLGAMVGLAISFGLIQLLQFIPDNPFIGKPQFSIEIALAAGSVLALIGLIAGLLPARRAANLDVIECLRT